MSTTARPPHEVVPHEPEPVLARGAEQVEDQLVVDGAAGEVHGHGGGGLGLDARHVVEPHRQVRHGRLGGERGDLGHGADERRLADAEPARSRS